MEILRENKVGKLEEHFTQETLAELVQRLRRKVALAESPGFVMGYCATDDETFGKVTDYLRGQLGIKEGSVADTEISHGQVSLRDYLIAQQENFNNCPGEIVMVRAIRFERLPHFADGVELSSILRGAHDYNQDVVQGQEDEFPRLKKKVLVVTHIGHSLGKERYERAVKSACQSQFKSFLYEFRSEKL